MPSTAKKLFFIIFFTLLSFTLLSQSQISLEDVKNILNFDPTNLSNRSLIIKRIDELFFDEDFDEIIAVIPWLIKNISLTQQQHDLLLTYLEQAFFKIGDFERAQSVTTKIKSKKLRKILQAELALANFQIHKSRKLLPKYLKEPLKSLKFLVLAEIAIKKAAYLNAMKYAGRVKVEKFGPFLPKQKALLLKGQAMARLFFRKKAIEKIKAAYRLNPVTEWADKASTEIKTLTNINSKGWQAILKLGGFKDTNVSSTPDAATNIPTSQDSWGEKASLIVFKRHPIGNAISNYSLSIDKTIYSKFNEYNILNITSTTLIKFLKDSYSFEFPISTKRILLGDSTYMNQFSTGITLKFPILHNITLSFPFLMEINNFENDPTDEANIRDSRKYSIGTIIEIPRPSVKFGFNYIRENATGYFWDNKATQIWGSLSKIGSNNRTFALILWTHYNYDSAQLDYLLLPDVVYKKRKDNTSTIILNRESKFRKSWVGVNMAYINSSSSLQSYNFDRWTITLYFKWLVK